MEDDENDDDGDDDDEYRPGNFGHDRRRAKRIQLDLDVDQLRGTQSSLADRRMMSSRAICDDVTNLVSQGGGNLYDLPCSQRAVIRFAVVVGVVSRKQKKNEEQCNSSI